MKRSTIPRMGRSSNINASKKSFAPVDSTARGMFSPGTKQANNGSGHHVILCAKRFYDSGIRSHELVKRVVASTESPLTYIVEKLRSAGLLESVDLSIPPGVRQKAKSKSG